MNPRPVWTTIMRKLSSASYKASPKSSMPSSSSSHMTKGSSNTFLNIALLALGLSILTVLILIQHQFEEKMTRDAQGIDLVVGAKGSPLQLILSSIYHIDLPTGNIRLEEAERVSKNRLIKKVI